MLRPYVASLASFRSARHVWTTSPPRLPMPVYSLLVNGRRVTADVAATTPLLWVLRDTLNLTGTKFGCGIALCGACTVHINGEASRSCITPISAVAGKKI